MALHEISFKSFNEKDTVKGWVYVPVVNPIGVVQLIHGFGEHSRRYFHMILSLLDAGYVVAADDHVGHGKTALDNNSWGQYGDKGYAITREDERSLYNIAHDMFPTLPYFLFGHSWGSMIARDYITVYGSDISGVILCGTAGEIPMVADLAKQLDALISEGRGKEVHGDIVGEIFGSFVERFGPDATPNDWIANDPLVVADHGRDPFNNLTDPPNVELIHALVALWHDISSLAWAQKVPNIPVYLIAGDQDPVGNYGEGIYKVSNWLALSGKDKVSTKLYSGYRHEIHNEVAIRDQVERGIVDFLNANI